MRSSLERSLRNVCVLGWWTETTGNALKDRSSTAAVFLWLRCTIKALRGHEAERRNDAVRKSYAMLHHLYEVWTRPGDT